MRSVERWSTRAKLFAARARFADAMPGWEAPTAYGVAAISGDEIEFPVANAGAHLLPALVMARVCGHRSGTATYPLTAEQLREAIELLSPAEACTDYEHPNLAAWRALAADGADTAAVFLAGADQIEAIDGPQRRLAELTQVEPLPDELSGPDAERVLRLLDAATEQLLACVLRHVDRLDAPSGLPGWSRLTILAHLRYLAESMARVTEAVLAGRPDDLYPGGRDRTRPGTLVPPEGETVAGLVDSLSGTARELSRLWHDLSPEDWDRPIVDRDHGSVALSRLLALRLTEVEVHGADLELPGLHAWSDDFVQTMLPLRIAWLERSRRRLDADLSLNGSWVLTDGTSSWLVRADGLHVDTGAVPRQRTSDCRLTGAPRDLLALLLGRPATLEAVGLPELTDGFNAAFPGP